VLNSVKPTIKSRSDDTLLTAGFNLRTQADILLQVPQGRHLINLQTYNMLTQSVVAA